MSEKFKVTGMTCSACSAAVEKAVSKVSGVDSVSVNLLTGTMQVDNSEDTINIHEIIDAVEQAGYGAEVEGKESSSKVVEKNPFEEVEEELKGQFLKSLAILIPLMYIAMGPMIGLPIPSIFVGYENSIIFAFTQCLLTLPVLYWNRKYFIRGFTSLFHRNPNMDSLIAIGSGAAFVYGIFVIYRLAYGMGHGDMDVVHQYAHDLYFESAVMILTLITMGKFLEARAKGKTGDAIEKLMDLTPQVAMVKRGETWVEIPLEDVIKGDRIQVLPGENIPVDAEILVGSTTVDESALTGESMPVDKSQGDMLMAATTNISGYVECEAKLVGEDTTISKIIQLVEDANTTKAPIAKLADKISGIFVPIVIGISIITFLIWMISGAAFSFALGKMISVLVISCPCALGLATPVAIMVGTGKGASFGILYKTAEAMEQLHHVDAVLCDKTGTITKGMPEVTDVYPENLNEDLLKAIVSLEKRSEHPLGKAIVEYYGENYSHESVEDYETVPGKGLKGRVNGHSYHVGNEGFMKEMNIDTLPLEKYGTKLTNEAKTLMYIGEDGLLKGIIGLADTLKDHSKEALEQLKARNLEIYMVTGDHKNTAAAIAKDLPIDKVIAGVLPGEKEEVVRQLQDEGKKVAMVGDGINDAPALARADIGVAIGAGTDIAMESADVVLMKSELIDFVDAWDLSGAVIKNIKQNLFWAFFYNTVGIPIAAGLFYHSFGLELNPMIAALAMSLSSVFVVTNALRLNSFRSKRLSVQGLVNKVIVDEMHKEEKMKQTVLHVEGMTCTHCKKRVEDALNKLEGVSAEVNLEKKEVYVDYPEEMDTSTLEKEVTRAGYEIIK
ncbi:MAG: heavy metal translocating P-type ATPase [Tissierellia bacterium]|nr:heavy metal translocating P-type ATPase [Tissierellia bacterium]